MASCNIGVLLALAYDGVAFHGFARQPGLPTIAGQLVDALATIDQQITEVRGTSRTDAGVHALDQRVAFDTSLDLPSAAWLAKLNRRLPNTIAVQSVARVAPGYAPRFHAVRKTYRYQVLCCPARDPLQEGRVWHVPSLSANELVRVATSALPTLVGTHDFEGFRSARDQRISSVRTIERIEVLRPLEDERLVFIEITGNGFLYNMVRIIIGTTVDAARGRAKVDALQRTLVSKDRRTAGITAPPQGLYLAHVELDDDP